MPVFIFGTADGAEKKEAEIPTRVELTLWGGTESILTARIRLKSGTLIGCPGSAVSTATGLG